MVLALDSGFNRTKRCALIASNLLDFVYFNSGMCQGQRADPQHGAYGLIGWGDVAPLDDLPTRDLVDEVLGQQHLIMADHTTRHWPEELYLPGRVVDRDNREAWTKAGALDASRRAASAAILPDLATLQEKWHQMRRAAA